MSNSSESCPFCSGAVQYQWLGASFINCAACGEYAVSIAAADVVNQLSAADRSKLRCVMAERRLKGLTGLFIVTARSERPQEGRTLMTIGELISEYPKNPPDFFDRALLNLTRMPEFQHPAGQAALGPAHEGILFSVGYLGAMLEQLLSIGYLTTPPVGSGWYRIAEKGWARAEKLRSPGADSHRAFVAMWFDKSQDEIFEKAIRPAIEADGRTTAVRIDQKEHNNRVDDEIIAEIQRSRFLVADFTGNRAGVYYEAGYAGGLRLPVVFCVQEADLPMVHFDTRQFNHIVYTNAEDLRVKLLNRIRATIPT